ncbi:MAG: ribosome hibernation-promoting factor, HPF/YfiA family [Patescibacteria group bacterium]
MPTIISGKNFKLSNPLKDYVSAKLHKLEKYSEHIIASKAELDHDVNQRTGTVYRAELSVTVPGAILMAGQKAEHMREAIDRCVQKLQMQITKYEKKKIERPRRAGARNKK